MLAMLSVIVEKDGSAPAVNELLHVFRGAVLGRMGLPLRERGLAVVSLVLDAPADEINRLAGKLGSLDGVSAKALFPKTRAGD